MGFELGKLQEVAANLKTCTETALNKKTFSEDQYKESLIQHNRLLISFLLVRNDVTMLKNFNCESALKFTDHWKSYKSCHRTRSAGKHYITTNIECSQNAKMGDFSVVRVVKYVNMVLRKYNTAYFVLTSRLLLFKKQLNTLFQKIKSKTLITNHYPINCSCLSY